ncbi:MAG: hypothetical protein ABIB93_01560 [Chloroflexota bacterium]
MAKRKLISLLAIPGLLCLFVISTPLSAAESEARWRKVSIPADGSGGNWVLAKGSDVAHLTRAVDGTLYAYANPTGTGYRLFKSRDSGVTWSYTGGVADTIVDIVTAPDDAGIICYATSSAVFRSTDEGNTFIALPPNPGGAGAGNIEITSVDVAGQEGRRDIAVATRDTDAGQFGGIFILKENEPFYWRDTNLGGYDVCAVRFSPGYAADRQLIAVVTDETDTFVTMKSGDGNWGATAGNARLSQDNSWPPVSVVSVNTVAIAFPDDYEAYPDGGHSVLFVGMDAGGDNGDVYRIDGVAAPGSSAATDLNIGSGYGINNIDVTGLSVCGEISDVNLMAGAAGSAEVYTSIDSGKSWRKSTKPPTGGLKTSVLIDHDFKDTGTAWAATSGTESAFSCSLDSGVTWNQLGLIDSAVNPGGILDLAPSPDCIEDNTLSLITFGGEHSLWYSVNAGATWERIFSSALPGIDSLNMVRLSPGYGSGSRVLYVTGMSGGNPALWRSEDNGKRFMQYTVPCAIDCIVAGDDNRLFIAGYDGTDALIYASTNGGFFFATKAAAGTQMIKSIVLSPDYGQDRAILAGNISGSVYWSDDDGVSFRQLPPDATAPPLSGNLTVAFDPQFVTNRTVYAGSSTADKGISRFIIGKSQEWERIDDTLPAGGSIKQVMVSAGGTLYAANFNPDAGMERSLNPSYSLGPTFENVSRGLESGAKLNNLWLSGSQLWAVDIAGTLLVTLTDHLVQPVVLRSPEDKSGGNGVLVNHAIQGVSLDWERTDGATDYRWQLDADGDFSAVPAGFEGDVTASAVPLPALVPGTTYYWRVRIIKPVSSAWSEKRSFTTSLGEAATVPLLLSPAITQRGVPRSPIFQWQAIAGADGYELVVDTDTTFSDPVISRIGTYALPATAWEANVALEYGTTYYWKVRAVSDRTESGWSNTGAFTTEALSLNETPMPTPPAAEIPVEKGTVRPSPELPPAPPDVLKADMVERIFYLVGALTICLLFLVVALMILVLKLRRFR